MGLFSSIAKIATPIAAIAGGPVGASMGMQAEGIGAQKDANAAARANRDSDIWAAQKNEELQREFAKNGIRWKVEDAKAAGIHPLVGLGATTTSFSPSYVGSHSQPGSHLADGLSDMGQNIGRAIHATQTQDQRTMSNLQLQGAQLDIEGKALDNQIKNSELRRLNQTGPAFPGSQGFISGQGSGGNRITEKPLERTASLAGSPHSEPGAIPDVGWAKTRTGVTPIPSGDVKNRIEDNMPHEWSHFMRNNIMPNFGGGPKPPKESLPKGYDYWKWSKTQQEYQPAKSSDKHPLDYRNLYIPRRRN